MQKSATCYFSVVIRVLASDPNITEAKAHAQKTDNIKVLQ